MTAYAAPADGPEAAAVRYVEKLRSRKVDLSPGVDTALSPATGEDKRKIIEERLNSFGQQIGLGALEVGPVKQDGDFAAVLVRQAAGFDPERLRVVAVGLLKKAGNWSPAPLPGSFENTGLGYEDALVKRVGELESWMMREQVVDLAKMRDESSDRLRKEILKKLHPDELHEASPRQVVERLIKACEARDQASVLGLLGGLGEELPPDWTQRISAVAMGLGQPRKGSPWNLLTTPGVIRAIITPTEGGQGKTEVDLVTLDPASAGAKGELPGIRSMQFILSRDAKNLWHIDLPDPFFNEDPDEDGEDAAASDSILAALPAAWREAFPAKPAASAKEAAKHLIDLLRGPDASSLLQAISLEGDAGMVRMGVAGMAAAWQDLHQQDASVPMFLGFHEEGDGAVAAYQFFSPRDPNRADLRVFYFVKSAMGWLMHPGMKTGDEVIESLKPVKSWADAQAPEWSKDWEKLLLKETVMLEKPPEGEAPTEEETRRVFEAWNQAVLHGDVEGVFAKCAFLDGDRGASRLLKNVGRDFSNFSANRKPAEILGVIRKGSWTGVSVRIGEKGDSRAIYPLYCFVATASGPRLLGELDLQACGGRTRDYLNDSNIGRLNLAGAGDAGAVLREIYEAHRKNSESDRSSASQK